ncbi:MAG: 7-carboxy-7-deazaguanine synthase QueE [Gammaproteobacteria bacterium]|nr:7-carboxy-7-deazaguanine synthase QueE [Gammaproteobacteria bacterium]
MSVLRITEIFHSLQGESRPAGYPTAFVRLTGCPLRCVYCDTSYAFQGGTRLGIPDVLERVSAFSVRHVCVTGGEPLAQPACLELLAALCDAGYAVSLETSGALDISAVDPRVTVVLDIKTPDSAESERNLWSNLLRLKRDDQIKFVICSRADYEWSKHVLSERGLAQLCEVLFSPSWGQLPARDLAEWILADRLPVRFQLQLHKYLWGDAPGH